MAVGICRASLRSPRGMNHTLRLNGSFNAWESFRQPRLARTSRPCDGYKSYRQILT